VTKIFLVQGIDLSKWCLHLKFYAIKMNIQ